MSLDEQRQAASVKAREVAKRELLNNAKFNSLYKEAHVLMDEKSFEEGLIKLRQAQMYVKPGSDNCGKIASLMAQGEREIRTILEIEAEWLYDK